MRHSRTMLRKTLDVFSDGERIKNLFQEQLPAYAKGSLTITQCRVLRSQYRPDLDGSSPMKPHFSASYELEVLDKSSQVKGVQMLYVKVYPDGCSKGEFRKNKLLRLTPPRFGDPLVHLPDLEMIVWAFPNDKKLTQLPDLIDPDRVKQFLPYENLPPGLDGPGDLTHVSVDVVRYRPDDRCTLRYRLFWGSPKRPQELTLYGKTFKDNRGLSIYRAIQHLWQDAKKHQEAFMVARPYGYHKGVKVIWQQALPGKPLIDDLSSGNKEHLLLSVAKGLARLHKIELPCHEGVSVDIQLATMKQQASEITRAFPRLCGRLQSLAKSLETDLPDLKKIDNKSVHGDFRVRELIVSEDRLGLFDFDDLFIGDPVQDLALFLVSLHWQYDDSKILHRMATTFFDAYRLQVNEDVSVDRMNWYIRMHFVKKAFWFYRVKRFDCHLENQIESVITLAERQITFIPRG